MKKLFDISAYKAGVYAQGAQTLNTRKVSHNMLQIFPPGNLVVKVAVGTGFCIFPEFPMGMRNELCACPRFESRNARPLGEVDGTMLVRMAFGNKH